MNEFSRFRKMHTIKKSKKGLLFPICHQSNSVWFSAILFSTDVTFEQLIQSSFLKKKIFRLSDRNRNDEYQILIIIVRSYEFIWIFFFVLSFYLALVFCFSAKIKLFSAIFYPTANSLYSKMFTNALLGLGFFDFIYILRLFLSYSFQPKIKIVFFIKCDVYY